MIVVEMDLLKKFAKDVGMMGVTQFVLGLQAFLLLPILTRFLGATDYGIWVQIKITVILLGGFAMLGLGSAIVRFMSGEEDKEKVSKEFISVLIIAVLASLILGAVVFIFSDRVGMLLTHVSYSGFFFKFIILMLLLEVVHELFITFIRAKENIRLFSIVEILRAMLEIGLIYVFLLGEWGLWGVVLAFVIVKATVILLGLLGLRKTIRLVRPSFKAVKPYLGFSLPLVIMPILHWVIQSGDQYIVGFYLGAKAVGIYGLAYSLCFVIRSLVDPIYMVSSPALSRAWNQNDKEMIKAYFRYSYKYVFMLAIPVMFGLSVLAEPILNIISTAEFTEGKLLLPFISAGFVLYCFWQLGGHLLFLKKETKKFTKIVFFLVVINVVLNILLVPFLGYLGAAVSTLVTFGVAAGFGVKTIRGMGFSLMGRFLFKCLFSSGLMIVGISILRNVLINEIVKMIMMISISVAVYFLTLFLLGGISKRELLFFKKLVLRKE